MSRRLIPQVSQIFDEFFCNIIKMQKNKLIQGSKNE